MATRQTATDLSLELSGHIAEAAGFVERVVSGVETGVDDPRGGGEEVLVFRGFKRG